MFRCKPNYMTNRSLLFIIKSKTLKLITQIFKTNYTHTKTEYLGDHSKISVAYVVNNGKILTTKSWRIQIKFLCDVKQSVRRWLAHNIFLPTVNCDRAWPVTLSILLKHIYFYIHPFFSFRRTKPKSKLRLP